MNAVQAGQCDATVVNTYYYGRLQAKKADDNLKIFWPNQDDRGTHVNISGVAITKASKNAEDARALIEFMLSEEAQRWYSDVNNEYPVVEGVEPSETLVSWGEFKADTLNLDQLGMLNSEAVRVMDRAGWR